MKSLRKIEILSKLVLSKKQEFLIPILKENILSLDNDSYLSPSDDIVSDSDCDGGFDSNGITGTDSSKARLRAYI